MTVLHLRETDAARPAWRRWKARAAITAFDLALLSGAVFVIFTGLVIGFDFP